MRLCDNRRGPGGIVGGGLKAEDTGSMERRLDGSYSTIGWDSDPDLPQKMIGKDLI